jgi:apolipoprotein N-acyltransferase
MRLPSRATGRRVGLSLLSAILLCVSVPTVGLWPLMWVALVPQIEVALAAPTPRRAFLWGWMTGFIANAVAFSWMDGLLERFGHMSPVEAIPIVALLVGYQGLAFGFFSWGIRRARDRTGLPLALLAPLVMVTIELVMPQIFPYYLAISQAFVPWVIQIADITGPLGVTALMLAFNGLFWDGWSSRTHGRPVPRRALTIVAALLVANLGYGHLRLHQVDARRAAAPKVRTGIVQANVGIIEKWDPRAFARLLDLHQTKSAELARAGAQLIVWPESSYPYALPRAPHALERDLPIDDPRRVRRGFDTPLMFGAVTRTAGPPRTPKDRYPYNTALILDGAGNFTGSYDKVFLMVFGEYIPFYDQIPWFTKLFPEASNFSRGSDPALFPLEIGGRHYAVAPLICYEDILPGFARRAAKLGPNAFINMTNDAWFGRTAEPYQHLALAVFRSVEHRLEMIRSVNTGVSAHIDAGGRVLAQTRSVDPEEVPPPPVYSRLVELAMLPGGGLYRTLGDLFGFLCLAALVALLVRKGGRASGRASGGASAAGAPGSGNKTGSPPV